MEMELDKSILATIAYYDIFDFPLTREEVFTYLSARNQPDLDFRFSQDEVDLCLKALVGKKTIDHIDGFYALPQREHLVPLRLKKQKIAVGKIKKAVRAAKILAAIPYIRAVYASGSLAMLNTNYESDLDVFIIVKCGRIWTARFLATLVMNILGMRRKPNHKISPDRVCLNHYITDSSLGIPYHGVFAAHNYANMLPLYLADESINENFKKANHWIFSYLARWQTDKKYLQKQNWALRLCKKSSETMLNTTLGDTLEKSARGFQKRRIEKNPVTKNPHGRIEYSDKCLEFHPYTIEPEVIARFNEKSRSLGII